MNILLNHSNYSNQDYNYVIKELQNYMFTEENIRALSLQVINPSVTKESNISQLPKPKVFTPFRIEDAQTVRISPIGACVLKEEGSNKVLKEFKKPLPLRTEKKEKEKENTNINYIKEKDSLFWSFFTMVNGDIEYELLKPIHLVKEKKIKIEYIEKLRQNKILLKQHKFATLIHIENQLLNETKIDLNTFFSLCVLENINIFYVYKKTYYELILDDSKPIFIIYRDNNNNSLKYSFEKITMEYEKIEKYRKEWYKIDVLNKPIKAISSYKLQELVDFCGKLHLDIINKETNKPKKKQELYEALVQNLC